MKKLSRPHIETPYVETGQKNARLKLIQKRSTGEYSFVDEDIAVWRIFKADENFIRILLAEETWTFVSSKMKLTKVDDYPIQRYRTFVK